MSYNNSLGCSDDKHIQDVTRNVAAGRLNLFWGSFKCISRSQKITANAKTID